jgi:hypothetical protein
MLYRGVNAWMKNINDFYMGTLLTEHTIVSLDIGQTLFRKGKPLILNDRSTISLLVKHLINTRLGAEDQQPRTVRLKNVPLGHPQRALAALSKCIVALVGHY